MGFQFYSKLINNFVPDKLLAMVVAGGLILTGCNASTSDSVNTSTDTSKNSLEINTELFSGCYTVSQSEPAQIKISQLNNQLVMQMKEPSSAKRVWDDPEPLENIPLTQIPNYFSIDTDNVTSMIGRPDRIFVVAHVKSAYVNINPLLDSDYLGFIYKGANTIFKVDCDEVYNDTVDNV